MPKRMPPNKGEWEQEEEYSIPISQIMNVLKYFTQQQNIGPWNERIPAPFQNIMAPAHTSNWEPKWNTVYLKSNLEIPPEGYYPRVGSKEGMKQAIMEAFGLKSDEEYAEFQKTDAFKTYKENLYRRDSK